MAGSPGRDQRTMPSYQKISRWSQSKASSAMNSSGCGCCANVLESKVAFLVRVKRKDSIILWTQRIPQMPGTCVALVFKRSLSREAFRVSLSRSPRREQRILGYGFSQCSSWVPWCWTKIATTPDNWLRWLGSGMWGCKPNNIWLKTLF